MKNTGTTDSDKGKKSPDPGALEESSGFDITSPVSSFLEKSKKQMEQYLRRVLSSSQQPGLCCTFCPSSIHRNLAHTSLPCERFGVPIFMNGGSIYLFCSHFIPEAKFNHKKLLRNCCKDVVLHHDHVTS